MRNAFNASGLATPFGAFSTAAWASPGRLLFVSGLTARDADGRPVGEGDIVAQTEQVLSNLEVVLTEVGGSLDDVVTVMIHVTGLERLDEIHEVRKRRFHPPYPASTLVKVDSLVDPRLLIEITAIAQITDRGESSGGS